MGSKIAGRILAGLVLMCCSVSAHAKVTGIRFEPKSPIVGHSVTAIAIDDRIHEVVKWSWSCTLADVGTSSPMAMEPTIPGRATLDLPCGGTYKVSLEVMYGGPMPPPPETVSVAATIARPDAIEIIEGLDVAVPRHGAASATTIRSRVMSRESDAGKHLLGMAQRRVRNRTWWDGKKDADQPWQPEAPGPMLFQIGGVIESWAILNIDPRDWAKIPHGKSIVAWDEDIRLVYQIGSPWASGKPVSVECPLGTEQLSIVKVDDGRWAVRRGTTAESRGAPSDHGNLPGSQRSLQDAQREADIIVVADVAATGDTVGGASSVMVGIEVKPMVVLKGRPTAGELVAVSVQASGQERLPRKGETYIFFIQDRGGHARIIKMMPQTDENLAKIRAGHG
jgi:hypothetical protein